MLINMVLRMKVTQREKSAIKKDLFYQRNLLPLTWNDLGSTVNIMLNSGVFSSNKATMTAADSLRKET